MNGSGLAKMHGLDGINSINSAVKDWLLGGTKLIGLSGKDSPIWNRQLSNTTKKNKKDKHVPDQEKIKEACKLADRTLSLLKKHIEEDNIKNRKNQNPNIKRIIVGHTVQKSKLGINSICAKASIWRIDIGLSAYYEGPTQALEILPDGSTRIIKKK